MFFDDHPRFLKTSQVAANLNRLNLRHEAIFGENARLFDGASVLDIASHDGRWTLAAIEAGARHVVGVEARPELTEAAHRSLEHYGAEPDRYELVTADIFDYLKSPPQFDLVMCLGFFYHTLRFSELLQGLVATSAEHVIVDTKVLPVTQQYIGLVVDHVEKQGHAAEDLHGHGDAVLVGTPSPSALQRMFKVYGFKVAHKVDWRSLVKTGQRQDSVLQGTPIEVLKAKWKDVRRGEPMEVVKGKPVGVDSYRDGRRLTWTFRTSS